MAQGGSTKKEKKMFEKEYHGGGRREKSESEKEEKLNEISMCVENDSREALISKHPRKPKLYVETATGLKSKFARANKPRAKIRASKRTEIERDGE